MHDPILEAYATKTASLPAGGRRLALEIPADVFSSNAVDAGTLQLLRAVQERRPTWARVLDVGCGYGALALGAVGSSCAAEADGVDRDALAVAFAQRNAEANGLATCRFRGGLAYDEA